MLKVDQLLKVVKECENFEEAELALLDLKNSFPEEAANVSAYLLKEQIGDFYFQSAAFEVLYSTSYTSAIEFINQNIDNINLYIFKSILECVCEDLSLINSKPNLLATVKLLNDRIGSMGDTDRKDIYESISWFRESYHQYL